MAVTYDITRRQETKLVRDALASAGINARVGHGKGTAWGWLHVNVGSGQDFDEHDKQTGDMDWLCVGNCNRCRVMDALTTKALQVAQEATGRSGEYGGCINIYTQDHWNQKRGEHEVILQPNWLDEFAREEQVSV